MKISILLIEDDADMRDLVATHLVHSGFDVLKAEDGIKGQALALQYSPDLIPDNLSDSRRDERTLNIPILMITAYGLILLDLIWSRFNETFDLEEFMYVLSLVKKN